MTFFLYRRAKIGSFHCSKRMRTCRNYQSTWETGQAGKMYCYCSTTHLRRLETIYNQSSGIQSDIYLIWVPGRAKHYHTYCDVVQLGLLYFWFDRKLVYILKMTTYDQLQTEKSWSPTIEGTWLHLRWNKTTLTYNCPFDGKEMWLWSLKRWNF